MSGLKLFVTGHKGFETTHFHELRDILANTDAKLNRRYGGVEVIGDLESVYRICLYSRTSNRVFHELAQFTAPDENKLYQAVLQIDWSAHFTSRHSIAVSATLSRSSLDHSQYVSLKVKDAIVDQFREKVGSRPVIDKRQPDCHIHINIHQNQATISLDLSGESLHRRGYRLQHAGAPLKEHLAASMIINAGWNIESAATHRFVDPMCGSGTFAIEAALIAANIAPGLDRNYYGFSKWLKHDRMLWQQCLERAEAEIDASAQPEIYASDHDEQAIKIAQENAARAGVEELIRFDRIDINDQQLAGSEKPTIVVSNPPYGERLQSEQGLAALYTSLGHYLKNLEHGRLYLISSSPDLYHRLRLNRVFKKAVKNGPLDCVIAGFEFNAGKSAEAVQPAKTPDRLDHTIQPLINRLKKNSKHIQRWARRSGVSCFRVYDADLPEFAFALDVYHSDITPDLCWYHMQEYQAPKTIDAEIAEQRIDMAKQAVLHTFDIDESVLYCKTRQRQRGRKQYQKQDHQGELFQVREGDAALLINLTDYLDSGLFLDHRSNRERVRNMAEGKSVLNLFCYTGAVGVQAMLGGADTVVNVDMSANYLKWAKENHDINNFKAGDRLAFIRADIVELLQNPKRFDIARQFDIIFLDPPSFSNSSKMQQSLDIQRDHEALISDAMKLLHRQGVMIFSTNRRGFRLSDSFSTRMVINDISRDTIPEDFKRRPHIHKCWEIRHRG